MCPHPKQSALMLSNSTAHPRLHLTLSHSCYQYTCLQCDQLFTLTITTSHDRIAILLGGQGLDGVTRQISIAFMQSCPPMLRSEIEYIIDGLTCGNLRLNPMLSFIQDHDAEANCHCFRVALPNSWARCLPSLNILISSPKFLLLSSPLLCLFSRRLASSLYSILLISLTLKAEYHGLEKLRSASVFVLQAW